MSFFDEVDEPPPRPARTEPRRSRSSGNGARGGDGRGGRRDHQVILRRQLVAVGAVLAVGVLLALVIHSCDVSAAKSALETYAEDVNNQIGASNNLGSQLFSDLVGRNGCSGPSALYQCVSSLEGNAQSELSAVQRLSVPGSMRQAQSYVVTTMRMRRDGLQAIAGAIEPAFTKDSAASAVGTISTGTSRFFASDVIYKAYAAPEIAGALNAGGIKAGSANAPPINAGQFVGNLGWLDPSFIANSLGVALPSTPKEEPPAIEQVAVGTNTMVVGVTNHVDASPPPTFTFTLTNSSHNVTDYDLACTISVKGLSITSGGNLAELLPNQTSNCAVTLTTSPPLGTYQVTAKVTAGPNPTNSNEETFPVDFLGAGQHAG